MSVRPLDTVDVPSSDALRLRTLGIDTHDEHVVYMHRDCHVCRAEGFTALARVEVRLHERRIVATLNVVDSDLVGVHEAGLSTSAWRALQASDRESVWVSHAPTLDSLSALRSKIYGNRLDARAFASVVGDIASGNYADVHIAAFLSACAGGRMSLEETVDLTRAMVGAGDILSWGKTPIADKHSVGGLPGNRTTPIVVAIVAAAGLTIPKTSSRAITSPAGTADVMDVLTRVDLDTREMREVVDREGGCLVWGGAINLSPADDILIRVARPLDIDGDAQLVASVLSKKIAAGASHVLIDMPVGPTAKVRSAGDADRLQVLLEQVAAAFGLQTSVQRTDGNQPVGRGIGPALEARDVLAVLRRSPDAPADLRSRALKLAAEVLELCSDSPAGTGEARASSLLDSGAAWAKFRAICQAQGAFREPDVAPLIDPIPAGRVGRITAIDCRRLARVAKLAGAPNVPVAGLELHVRLGDLVQRDTPLLTLHARAPGELAYAKRYLASHPVVSLGPVEAP